MLTFVSWQVAPKSYCTHLAAEQSYALSALPSDHRSSAHSTCVRQSLLEVSPSCSLDGGML